MLGLECIGYGQWRPRASAPPRFVRFALCQRGHRACKRFVRFALCQRRHRACKREGEDGAKHEHDTRTAARRVTEAEVRSHGHAVAGILEICDKGGRSQPGFFGVVPFCVTCLRFGDNTTTTLLSGTCYVVARRFLGGCYFYCRTLLLNSLNGRCDG